MKKSMLIFSIIIMIVSVAFSQENNTKSGTIIVKIKNLENNFESVRVGLYNSKASFNGKGKPFAGKVVKPTKQEAIAIFKNVPFGIYAIKIFHDENNNGKLDFNLMGIPSEGYGFSNNASGFFGPAEFKDAKFDMKEREKILEIKIQ